MINIRQAALDDLPQLAWFGGMFKIENGTPGVFSEERFIKTWTAFITGLNGIIFMAEDIETNEPCGAISGFIAPDLYTLRTVAQECFWYTTIPHRATRLGLRLFDRFEMWAGEQHADIIRVGCENGPHFESLSRYFCRKGYVHIESHFERSLCPQ